MNPSAIPLPPAPAAPVVPAQLRDAEIDVLREVANIGAGHAATALSTMIGSTIMISVPRVSILDVADVPPVVSSHEEPVAAVLLHMLGDLTGRTLLVFPCVAALRLAEMLMQREPSGGTELREFDQSAVMEVGNILSSAYMNALAEFLGMMLIPSPPTLKVDRSAAVLIDAHTRFALKPEQVLFVESEFLLKELDEKLRGFFLLLPDPASLGVILRSVRA
jgi:chemotaxis protein CheC